MNTKNKRRQKYLLKKKYEEIKNKTKFSDDIVCRRYEFDEDKNRVVRNYHQYTLAKKYLKKRAIRKTRRNKIYVDDNCDYLVTEYNVSSNLLRPEKYVDGITLNKITATPKDTLITKKALVWGPFLFFLTSE